MKDSGLGFTKMYNRFHSNAVHDSRLDELRVMQCEMDTAVARAYGWSDLDLSHGFHEVPYLPENDRVRFTISETARVEVLRRLSELNRQRYQDEVAAGLHGNSARSSAPKTAKRQAAPAKATSSPHQAGLDFGISTVHLEKSVPTPPKGNQWGEKSSDQILAWLEAHTGWFAKQAILVGCGAAVDDWNAAIAELLRDEFVEPHTDGSRWRAKP